MAARARCAEFILHIVNFLYFVGGVIVMTFGAIGIANVDLTINTLTYIPSFSTFNSILNLYGLTYGPSIYLVIAGVLAIVLSFVGCGGAFKRHRTITFVYGGTNLIFMLFNIALIMYHVIVPYNIESLVANNMNQTLVKYFNPVSINNSLIVPPTNADAEAWVNMQFTQGCCGVYNYTSYEQFTWKNTDVVNGNSAPVKVPPSCCTLINTYTYPTNTSAFADLGTCLYASNSAQYVNTKGCLAYVMSQVTQYDYVYTVVAAALTGFQAIVLVLTMRTIERDFERHV